jgi:uncharacterized DUF497 family protein
MWFVFSCWFAALGVSIKSWFRERRASRVEEVVEQGLSGSIWYGWRITEWRFSRKAGGNSAEEAHTGSVDSSRTRDSRVIEFEWDEENREHIARHGLRVEDVEFALQHRTLDLGLQDWQEEERFSEVGMTANGRVIEVVTTWRGNKVRIVTAYDATKRKRILFSRDREGE